MRCGKIICVGQNYRAHIKEMSSDEPIDPVLFLKPSTALIGDGRTIIIPPDIGTVHHEIELALIIGRSGRNISADKGLQYVRSVAVFNDVTARDMQAVARKAGLPWSLCKGMDTFAPISDPMPLREVGDLHSLDLELKVNGELRQKGNTAQMIFTPEELISYISRFMTLERGDIIATGTPSGVGPIKHGDEVYASIPGVGSLTNKVRNG
ncbi:MAG: fumarylacetoacetate hydrolase family protein [Methanomassiliicoccales archaeon]|nr:fumarylacetoacetate hydrolase family protein [Methanomassiliicoccales archaeon]TFG56358.1 MAG: FAA hydrolase family protein [Methanomassiliicoccus sp.]